MSLRGGLCFLRRLPLQWLVVVVMSSTVTSFNAPTNHQNFQFTRSQYNGTIFENAMGNTYITSMVKMGIQIVDPSLNVHFRIADGNSRNVFRAEEDCVRDFCFLRVRKSTGMTDELNRELHDHYRLKIKAVGKYITGPQFEAFTYVDIFVLDLNDLSPLFYPEKYSVNVPENTPLHKSIIHVSASDADTGINGEIYYSFVKPTNIFSIHPTSGVVSLTRHLKYSEMNYYELIIAAHDRGPREGRSISRGNKAVLTIRVEPVNYMAPEIKVQNHPSVIEHGSQGTVYAIITVSDKDKGDNGKIDVVWISEGNIGQMFRIVRGSDSGIYNLVVNTALDREQMPFGYNLTITASDNGRPPRTTSTTVHVRIQDANDHHPKFDHDIYKANVSEVVPVFTPVLFVHAGDRDLGLNAEVRYRIVGGNKNNLFVIDHDSGLISTNSTLDAELVSEISLLIHAEDQANSETRKIGKTRVVIDILDYNDNAPVFNVTHSAGSVKENAPIGTSVMKVAAWDADSGENGKVSFSVTNADEVPFDVDHFTGIIQTTQILDYETMRRTYHVKIRASDWGVPFRQESDKVVTIKLENVNDNCPEFEKTDCTGYLSRDTKPGTQLVILPAIDFDDGNIITYSIVSGNDDDCFKIEPSTGAIALRDCDLLDYPHNARIISVVATDGELMSTPTTVEMTLVNSRHSTNLGSEEVNIKCKNTDVLQRLQKMLADNNDDDEHLLSSVEVSGDSMSNSNAPQFLASVPYYIEVSEGTPIGTTILNITAVDKDTNAWYNSKVLYVVSVGNSDGKFKIDTFNGNLMVMSGLDRELVSEYRLLVTAQDMGRPSRTATRSFRIVIADENDNIPKFEYENYSTTLYENVLVNSTVLQVYANDADSGMNARIMYSILTDTDDFSIDLHTGMIKVKNTLDRERQKVYHLEIEAKDTGQKKRLSSTTLVTISLLDVNDNTPKFVPETYNIKVREDLPIGTVIMTLTAVDPDANDNGRITYKLVDGMDSKFSLDKLTGTIRITEKLDYKEKQVFNITARAEDWGKPKLISTCLLNVEVVDVNENLHPPQFESFIRMGSVAENERIGTFVMHVVAHDPDGPADKSGQIIYSIQDGTGLGRFTIDTNGTIRTNQVLDRETSSHYWLTIFAQDRGLVPQFARQEVLIEVLDINDNVPLSKEPCYHATIPENSRRGIPVVKIQATDGDKNPEQRLRFEITGGNPQHFFRIDPVHGVISTTNRSLNREKQAEHALEVTIYDNGIPVLSSTTRVVIKVDDVNDEKPRFIDKSPEIQVLEQKHAGHDIPIYRVVTNDRDVGQNANVTYFIKNQRGNGHTMFRINPLSGLIYSTKDLVSGKTHDLQIKAVDGGQPPRRAGVRIRIEIVDRPTFSAHPPRFTESSYFVSVTENDPIGHLVVMLSAEDDDGNSIWFSIMDGDDEGMFMVQPKHGSLLLAHQLDWETKSSYNLTVCATDGVHDTCTWVYVKVIDINDNEPEFSNLIYMGEVVESVEVGSSVLQLTATDRDEDKKLIYTFSSAGNLVSLHKFNINPHNGIISVAEPLDREALARHILTIMVRDRGTPSKRSFARVTINVLDHNDHTPQFLSTMFEGRVFETAAVGTSVVQTFATDNDKGDNAEISFSILSGNVGGSFVIDRNVGIVSVGKELDRSVQHEYDLVVMAADKGEPSLSTTCEVKIHVTMSNNAPPKFWKMERTAELRENQPPGVVVIAIHATSQSSIVYDISAGNDKGYFSINPNSGVISTKQVVDYETDQLFNLTITATNIVGAETTSHVTVHILDENDNHPRFHQRVYLGNISEAAPPNSMILSQTGSPLVIKGSDEDSGTNALLTYEITDPEVKEVFTIDPGTGAIRTKLSLDHEKTRQYNFSVQVTDLGKPRLRAETPAVVIITVTDVNDSPPQFSNHTYRTRVLLPTYKDVAVIHLHAHDADSSSDDLLTYSIVGGNAGNKFALNPQTGVMFVRKETGMASRYELKVQVSDGKFDSTATVIISVQQTVDSGLRFTKKVYLASVQENMSMIKRLTVVQTVGHKLNERLRFALLNNKDEFSIGHSSGALKTKGIPFNREMQDNYTVVVRVTNSRGRLAHVVVMVTVLDENDNAPMFVNQPYHSVVSFDAAEGEIVKRVTAVDVDDGKNGDVRYSIIDGSDQKFLINHITGDISVRTLTHRDQNKVFSLMVEAQDKGRPPHRTLIKVPIHVINRDSPIFEKSFYNVSVPENIAMHSPVLSIQAFSPKNQKLIYSITKGDKYGDFAVDFNTAMDVLGPCLVSVIGEIDYEEKPSYELTLRATDTDTGSYTEALIFVRLQDHNDNAPVFHSQRYTTTVLEISPISTPVLTVSANDSDTGSNSFVHYSIAPNYMGSSDVEHFHMNSETGVVMTKKPLDHENQSEYFFLVVATDSGMPALSSTALVHVIVMDVNDNPPRFSQPSYDCTITDQVQRGQLVMKLIATDNDQSDGGSLYFSIIDGNEKQAVSINSTSGLISISRQRSPKLDASYTLNVSVSDGVYTSFARVTISVRNTNRHYPQFTQISYYAELAENMGEGLYVASVLAIDNDHGTYGMLTYTIQSEALQEIFRIDADTGELFTKTTLDREKRTGYMIPVAATDNGGHTSHTTVHVNVRDANDNLPKFLMQEYKGNVYYNATVGTFILQVTAVDADEGVNGKVIHSIYDSENLDVMDVFEIDADTGVLRVRSSLEAYTNNVYQFFVRARDQGQPSLEDHVSVHIVIMGANDVAPKFDKTEHAFFIPESEQIGSVIATIKAVSDRPVTYNIMRGFTASSNDPPKFSIGNDGQIRVIQDLDREETAAYHLSIKAESQTSPPLIAYTKVNIQLRDKNDNDPVFDSNPYVVTVVENAEPGMELVQLHAQDADHPASFSFTFGHNMEKLANIFHMDSHTGWLTLSTTLDREQQNEYNISVVVYDSPSRIGGRRRSTSTSVLVTVTDHNDNPPVFDRQLYKSAVNEEALPGTVLVFVHTTDADVGANAEVFYYIIDGDPLNQFHVHSNGEVFVNKALDRETTNHYRLTIAATDGGFVSTAIISIDILDDNDHSPKCDEIETAWKGWAENLPIGSPIVQVHASDDDEAGTKNAKIRYSISGFGSEMFKIDKESGVIQTRQALDRETHSEYRLMAKAVDGGGRSCQVEVLVFLKDVNDNAPEFTMTADTFSIHEDARVNTLLTRVTAIDKDSGINRQIQYKLGESTPREFSIDPQSGIVSLVGTLDREKNSKYDITVVAFNVGSPEVSSETMIHVVVLDVNDNPPEFERTSYYMSIREDAAIRQRVITITATSRDIGINADLTYSIVAGNEQGKFLVEEKTGVIRVAEPLDHELSREYFLTLMAKDNGIAPLSNTAIVNINITDVNDNAPQFGQLSYSTTIREDAKEGTQLIHVLATDADSVPNAQITYIVASGNNDGMFLIGPVDGILRIKEPLDREKVGSYALVIQARDSGSPSLTATAIINIEVLDANDNPPHFSQENYTAFVQEGRRVGIQILQFSVTDDDQPENQGPFSFDIIRGNDDEEFHVNAIGILSTAGKLNKQIKDVYRLTIRAFDSGQPPQYSDTIITIHIIDESMHAPVVRNLSIAISSYMDKFAGGVIGKVEAQDSDPYDELIFTVVSPNQHLFEVRSDNGLVIAHAGLDAGNYIINISVTDGKFSSYGIVGVKVSSVSEEMVDSAVTVQFRNMIPEQFFASIKKDFQRVLKRELSVRASDVQIINVQPSVESVGAARKKRSAENNLDVLFAVRKSPDKFYNRNALRRKVDRAKGEIERILGVDVVKVFSDICTKSHCDEGSCVGGVDFDGNNLVPVVVGGDSFVSARHKYTYHCICLDGSCPEETRKCGGSTCPPYKLCEQDALGRYSCICPNAKTGEHCDEEIERCRPTDINCQTGERPMTFIGRSYAKWTLGLQTDKRLTLSMWIRTRKSTANLMYSKGRVDYSILEIINGMLQYRFDCGSGPGLVRIPIDVNDGKWHKVMVERNGRSAELLLDETYKAMTIAPGGNDILNLDTDDIYFGAEVNILHTGYRDITKGFEGCIKDIRLFDIPLLFSGSNKVSVSQEFEQVDFHCKEDPWQYPGENICSSFPCMHGGTCMYTGLNSYKCQCKSRYYGDKCEVDSDPCQDMPCTHQGQCLMDTDIPNGYQCQCPGRFQGKRCEYGHNCIPNPCQNGGTCIEGPNSPICHCIPGFKGPRCDLTSNICQTNPCLHGGICHVRNGQYFCNCTTGELESYARKSTFRPSYPHPVESTSRKFMA
ncbi:protocadherin Fat 1-like isoform X2 [Gigantopelta aegis]|uniref:protocadherin Fat 1-like isoform X2 n=1 Tax=Gigantopelta aegis TaxID=1735272 RepID=UPI001B88D844|nr:protocadherin Fat 1-like isoform X2 [Gigantopelta aegis]